MRPDELRQKFPRADPEFLLEYIQEDLIHRIALRATVFRLELGLSQADVAARIGKGQSYISSIEAGFQNMTTRTLALLAYALERDPSDFLRVNLDLEEIQARLLERETLPAS
ncbi:MAG: helix-turn-helix domain-containing protein [Gemmatimonadota bacterium]